MASRAVQQAKSSNPMAGLYADGESPIVVFFMSFCHRIYPSDLFSYIFLESSALATFIVIKKTTLVIASIVLNSFDVT